MELTWYGLSCFRLTERGQSTVVTDPYDGKVGLPPLKLKADILTISHDAPGHNCEAAVTGHKHALRGPGEYEIGGVFVRGITTSRKSTAERRNVIFVFEYSGLNVVHLGDLDKVPSQSQIDELGEVNVLLIPVGGGNTLSAPQAAELVSLLEPNVVIPMHYHMPELTFQLGELERFLKEMGVSEFTPEANLKITRSSLPEETQVVVLTTKL
ncbi:MAG: MBL fold metallo-hydrolase [Chloroflexi bacterium]|nr:MBL fold metallo-hydrolase [Chloroflexota bacterium]MDA0243144.1 MBL fold metallo-hydrolase [Chloroflexota bacterium]